MRAGQGRLLNQQPVASAPSPRRGRSAVDRQQRQRTNAPPPGDREKELVVPGQRAGRAACGRLVDGPRRREAKDERGKPLGRFSTVCRCAPQARAAPTRLLGPTHRRARVCAAHWRVKQARTLLVFRDSLRQRRIYQSPAGNSLPVLRSNKTPPVTSHPWPRSLSTIQGRAPRPFIGERPSFAKLRIAPVVNLRPFTDLAQPLQLAPHRRQRIVRSMFPAVHHAAQMPINLKLAR